MTFAKSRPFNYRRFCAAYCPILDSTRVRRGFFPYRVTILHIHRFNIDPSCFPVEIGVSAASKRPAKTFLSCARFNKHNIMRHDRTIVENVTNDFLSIPRSPRAPAHWKKEKCTLFVLCAGFLTNTCETRGKHS